MQVVELRVDQFRCFNRHIFRLAPSFCGAVGINGTGKTALIEAIAVVLGALVAVVSDDENPRPLGSTDKRVGQDAPAAVEAVVRVGNVRGKVRVQMTPDGQVHRISKQLLNEIRRDRDASEATKPLVRYFQTARLWHAESAGSVQLSGAMRAYSECLDPASGLRGLTALIEEQRAAPDTWRTDLDRAFQMLLGESGRFLFDERTGALSWKDGKTSLPLRALADGVRNLATITADLVLRSRLLSPTGVLSHTTRGVVLIDEIDLHLHPVWQRRIVNVLRHLFPRVQFVVTTHSPFVVKELRPGELVNLGGGSSLPTGSVEDVAEEVMGVPLPQRSRRQELLTERARVFFSMLSTDSNPEAIARARRELDDALLPFADDAATIALLHLEELAARGRQGKR
jgi:predicted ATP-binding protein involved in virulence